MGSTNHQILAGFNAYNQEINDSNLRYNVLPTASSTFNIFEPRYFITSLGSEVLTTRRIAYTNSEWQSCCLKN